MKRNQTKTGYYIASRGRAALLVAFALGSEFQTRDASQWYENHTLQLHHQRGSRSQEFGYQRCVLVESIRRNLCLHPTSIPPEVYVRFSSMPCSRFAPFASILWALFVLFLRFWRGPLKNYTHLIGPDLSVVGKTCLPRPLNFWATTILILLDPDKGPERTYRKKRQIVVFPGSAKWM